MHTPIIGTPHPHPHPHPSPPARQGPMDTSLVDTGILMFSVTWGLFHIQERSQDFSLRTIAPDNCNTFNKFQVRCYNFLLANSFPRQSQGE